jgi:threonine-phosphate decarboxylase
LAAIPGMHPYPSTVSFVLARLPDGLTAASAWECLAAERILIRDCSNFAGLSERFIRICPRSHESNRRAAEALARWAGAVRGRKGSP